MGFMAGKTFILSGDHWGNGSQDLAPYRGQAGLAVSDQHSHCHQGPAFPLAHPSVGAWIYGFHLFLVSSRDLDFHLEALQLPISLICFLPLISAPSPSDSFCKSAQGRLDPGDVNPCASKLPFPASSQPLEAEKIGFEQSLGACLLEGTSLYP